MSELGKCHYECCRSKNLKISTLSFNSDAPDMYSIYCEECHSGGPTAKTPTEAFDKWSDIYHPITFTDCCES
jgi:hypothetical protein